MALINARYYGEVEKEFYSTVEDKDRVVSCNPQLIHKVGDEQLDYVMYIFEDEPKNLHVFLDDSDEKSCFERYRIQADRFLKAQSEGMRGI